MAVHTTAQKQFIEDVATAAAAFSTTIEQRRGYDVSYGEIGIVMSPAAKSHAVAAALDENIITSDDTAAFGFGRFLAKTARVPFALFDTQANTDNSADLLRQLLFMQEGAIAAVSGGHCDVGGVQHAHDTLRGYLFEVTSFSNIGAKMPGGRQLWFAHRRNLISMAAKLLPVLEASCHDADALMPTGQCSERPAMNCGELVKKLRSAIENQVKQFGDLAQNVTQSVR